MPASCSLKLVIYYITLPYCHIDPIYNKLCSQVCILNIVNHTAHYPHSYSLKIEYHAVADTWWQPLLSCGSCVWPN